MLRLKHLLRTAPLQEALSLLLAAYIRCVRWTSRFDIVGAEHLAPLIATGQPFIAAFWHGRIMMMAYGWRGKASMHLLVSGHADGLLIGRIMRRFGAVPVLGGGTRRGSLGLKALVKAGREGKHLVITPDGPQGPRMRAKPGIVAVARATGLPVLPATYAVSRRKVLGSWDRFILALPFSRGVFMIGAPILAGDREPEAIRLEIEESLNRLTEDADRRVGAVPIAPAGIDERRRSHRELAAAR